MTSLTLPRTRFVHVMSNGTELDYDTVQKP
jgi:hypothetical protein